MHNGDGKGESGVKDGTGEGDEQRVPKTEGEEDMWALSLPLVKALHDLEALAASVQLSSSPAIISQEGISLQQHILKVHFETHSRYVTIIINTCLRTHFNLLSL